jgi:hypothetical protein
VIEMITKNGSLGVRTACATLLWVVAINLPAVAGAQWLDPGQLSTRPPSSTAPLLFDPLTSTVTVSPSGSDDTQRLHDAFMLCAAIGPHCAVRLTFGTFLVTRLVVTGFQSVMTVDGHPESIEPVTPDPDPAGAADRGGSLDGISPSQVTFMP